MVCSDVKKFPHYIDQLELDKQQPPSLLSYEDRLKVYDSLLPACQELAKKTENKEITHNV